MDFAATQIYEEDENFLFTQRISHALEEEELVQVGTLSIDSTDYQIKRGTTKIGRLSSCDIVINDAAVSKLHAEIEASGSQGSVWICDLNSSNKTKLNDLILRSTRSYELKDGSVIEFGRVRATYRTYRPADDTVIPETPAPSRQKIASSVIPNTPDSSLNNSSGVDNDGSIILGTQKDEENSVFRRPRVPQQRESTSIDKKNISCASSMSEGNDSRIATVLHTSNVSKNQVSIFEAETQKFEEGHKMASNSIHDMETQRVDTDMPEQLVETNAEADKQLPKLNVCDKGARRSITDIHDLETQNCIDDISEMKTQKYEINIRNVTGKKFTTDIHNMETQRYDDEDSSGTQKSEISKKNIVKSQNSQKKNLAQIGHDIHDLETQKFDNKYIAEDISDLETQLELNSIASCKQSRDISDMETQLEADNMADETNNDRANKNKDKDVSANITKDGTSHENVTKSPKSRSSSPGSLNLSSPGVEDCPSSLNQSSHLLESSDLLEFFGENIDKQEAQASNTSTPKPLKKVSSKTDSNVGNAVNNDEENNDEDIFEAPTQRVNRSKFEALMSNDSETDEEDALIMCKIPKKKRGKPQSKQTNDDSETDAEEYVAELAKKQLELSSEFTSSKSFNENINNRNDPGTSIESEDMFDAPTQRLDKLTTKDTNSLLNQSQEANEVNKNVDDMASTQIIDVVDRDDQTNMPTSEINDVEPTQLILSRETSPALNSKNFASKDNQNNEGDMTTMHIYINTESVDCCTSENLDREDADYELAPTQVIGEIEDKGTRNSIREKGSSQMNLNDTVEQKLTEMFDDVNNEMNSNHESPHMSTQYLEDILESSQCHDSTNKSTAGDGDADNVRQKQLGKNHASCNQHSHNLLDTEVNANVNKAETDSQSSDVYFSTITTRRKRNILRDTQEHEDSVEDTTPSRQDVNSSRASKANNEKAVDDNVSMESNKRRKRISKTKNKSDATKTLNDDDENKTISSRNNERSLRSKKSMKQKDETTSETSEQVLERDSAKSKVDDAEENISICIPCPSNDGRRAQTLDASYEMDDDILTRLPAVRISGTLSNPASPSASSTSTVHSPKSNRSTPRSKKKRGTPLRGKSLRKRNIGNSGKNKLSVDNHSNSVLDALTVKISGFVDTSDDESDNEITKRFQQIAERMLSTEVKRKQQAKGNRTNARVSQDVSEDPKQNTVVESKNRMPTSSRMTRHSSRQNDESDIQKEVRAQNAACGARFTESEMKSTVAKRKMSLNIIEKGIKQASLKKRRTTQVTEECPVSTRSRRSTMKTDRQSPNILDCFTKMSSRESSPIIENTKSSENNKAESKTALGETQKTSLNTKTDENVDHGRSNVKQARRLIYDSQDTIRVNDVTANENGKKNKPAETKETEIEVSHSLKVLRVLLSPVDDGSQEVERIMATGPSNVQDKNLPIRESSSTKIFQRKLRTRNRKRSNLDTETDSVLTNSDMSSEIGNFDNTQFDNSVPKAKRGRLAESSVSSQPKAKIPKKKGTFKKPTRITHNQTSTSSILDSTENISESSQGSTESDASTSSRVSRSKAASIRKKEKMESNQNTRRPIDNNASSRLNTSAEITSPVSTPSRTRRSTSILSNCTPSAMRHKVLFTGITEDYSKIVKTLGGNKVEDPAKCTILVTDKVRRTYKFLCALAQGVPIVAIDWLRDSETAARFLEWENYILKDPAAEAKFGFRLRKSLDKAKEKKLLDGYTVVLTPSVAPPPIEELKNMVSSCGGKALLRPPIKWPERAVILSREEDLPNARKFLAKAPKTVTVQSTEFILTGILRQETDFDKYKLT